MHRNKNKFLLSILLLSLISCDRHNKLLTYNTWGAKGESYPKKLSIDKIDSLSPSEYPIAGIVSHHLLAGELIDSWFKALKEKRDVKTFFILSPDHWNVGIERFSLTDLSWKTAEDEVRSNLRIVKKLQKSFNVELERDIFHFEHGVSTLIPFIKRYFPESEVVAIVYPGEIPIDMDRSKELYASIKTYFDRRKKEDNFLLVSSDFAHHSDIKGTNFKDERSKRFLLNPGRGSWIFAGCDNRPAMYVLGNLIENSKREIITSVMYHSNSYEISKKDENDITSYFFYFISQMKF